VSISGSGFTGYSFAIIYAAGPERRISFAIIYAAHAFAGHAPPVSFATTAPENPKNAKFSAQVCEPKSTNGIPPAWGATRIEGNESPTGWSEVKRRVRRNAEEAIVTQLSVLKNLV